MDKQEYITRQLERTRRKRYENYVVGRIWHKLDDLSVKIVTQQHIARPDGRALSDLYFPQLGLHVEVNEGHHYGSRGVQRPSDAERAKDIVNATGHAFEEIKVAGEPLEKINAQVDALVERLKSRIAESKRHGGFIAWDADAEYSPSTYIEKGYIDEAESVAFRRIVDACRCFGRNYKGVQKAYLPHGWDPDCYLWFPKLYPNGRWMNSTSKDESEIYEMPITPMTWDGSLVNNQAEYLQAFLRRESNTKRRIVFAHAKDSLGVTLYRFKGIYQFSEERSRESGTCLVYRKIGNRVRTRST